MTEEADPELLLAQGRIAEAEDACERRLQNSPDDIAALKIAGLGALRRALPGRAIVLLERAARIAPDDSLTLH
ncbi:MAG: hypothetical protein WB440_18795, partial [Steroidobacteraceae bacterium]